ncbi:Multidrug resistance protein MdtC [Thalassocella blandensis]|nr:Multidrug resistance protein MdtC [Thalassocella blandensis]
MQNLVKWFIENPIAANFLMILMLLGGLLGSFALKKEVFPAHEPNYIHIDMVYPGAAPTEVEQQIVVRIEEVIAGIPGIFKITSESRLGSGTVTVEVVDGYDVKDVLADVKMRVDSINTFPASAERPTIRQPNNRQTLIWFTIFGKTDLATLKKIAYQVRDEMSLLEGISQVYITGMKSDEVSIEVSENTLREYQLTFDEIASAIRQSSMNVPAGTIRTQQGNIQVQTRAQAYNDQDFASVVVRSHEDGTKLYLGDIAKITDGFAEQEIEFYDHGMRGLNFQVMISDDPDLFGGTANAKAYLQNLEEFLPDNLEVKINFEMRSLFDSRFNLLKDNALSGLLLVFLVLMLFLRPLIAIWAVIGIVTTFAGTIWLLPFFDISLNMLSMFAFIMVLGIVVDDAIIIGESIYTHQHQGLRDKNSAIIGTKVVLKPVMLAVLSTVVFFMPLLNVPTETKPYTLSIFFVVAISLIFSLVESMLILPSHLSHMKPEKPAKNAVLKKMESVRYRFSEYMEHFATKIYKPTLHALLRHKASTVLAFFIALSMSAAVYLGGWINTSFMPNVPRSWVMINVAYPEGTSFNTIKQVGQFLDAAVVAAAKDETLLKANGGQAFIRETNKTLNGNRVDIFVGLYPDEERTVTTQQVSERLGQIIGPIPEAQQFNLNYSMNGNQADITLNLTLSSNRREDQKRAVDEVKKVLAAYPGVSNVRSNLESERIEVELDLKPHAENLGVSLSHVANQVRQGFYGEEVQRIPRSKEDVKVMLRYPLGERSTLDTLGEMRIRNNDHTEVPLDEVAQVTLVPGYSTIRRVDRRRNITITAEVSEGADANLIVSQMLTDYAHQWKREYVGFDLSRDGNLRAQARFEDNLIIDFLKVLFVVYGVFAIAFRSIFQPMLVLMAVPFGCMGAIFGHLFLGLNISMMSFFGFLACSGVVVNDNLVLLDRINQLRARGLEVFDAVLNAGVDRFRAIVLTSLTTFVGLLPILFERSGQAQFLKPMVVSLAFGVVLASTVTLLMVPAAYYSFYRTSQYLKRLNPLARSATKPASVSESH